MPTFFEIAAPLAQKGIPVIRVQPNSKAAMDSDWPSLATTNLDTIRRWSDETPNANVGCVAKAESNGYFFLEMDAAGQALRIKDETQKPLPQTLLIRSRPGRGHLYFKQNEASIALGNVAQGQVKGGGFSVRVHNQYVCGPGSIHPATGLPYQIVDDAPIVEAPQWLLDWIQSQRIAAPVAKPTSDEPLPIITGSRNSTLASIAGKFRANGVSEEGILDELLRINEERCEPSLPEDEVRTIAKSISKYKQGDPVPQLLFGGKPGGSYPEISVQDKPVEIRFAEVVEAEEPPEIAAFPYPVFPQWCMLGTSLYEGMVKPWCDVNSRYPEFMFMPAMAILLNFIGVRVRVDMNHFIPSLHMVLIGRKGQVIKSSCAETAMEYFKGVGMADDAKTTGTAEGRVLIWTAGSPEGLGIDMERKNCKNALLFYDELRRLVAKAGIENSAMIDALLTTYESGKYSNVVTNKKNSFSFDPKSYCMSFIACTTDKSFRKQWSLLGGEASGLNDRFFFLYQPKVLMPVTKKRDVFTNDAALITRKLVDKAITKGVYKFDESDKQLDFAFNAYSNRAVHRAERFALYFAIDLDKDEIDGDCIERALALVEYETAVKKYLRINQTDAETREAIIQNEIRFQMQQSNGKCGERELYRNIGYRYGFTVWGQSLKSMVDAGEVRKSGRGTRSDPKILVLMEQNDFNDED